MTLEHLPASLPQVATSLNYLAPMQEPVCTWTYDPPHGGPRFNGQLQAHAVTVHDARPIREQLDLDVHGFVLADAASAVRDFWDEDELRSTCYPEAAALLCRLTAGTSALVFDHTLRRRAPGRPPLDGAGGSFASVRTPVGRVHADYTPVSAPQRLRQLLGAPAAERRLRSRYMIVGLWRPTLTTPLLDAPLALADARSVGAHDLVRNELIYPNRRGETYVGVYSPHHRWHYFARQRRDEVIVFKNFDSVASELGVAAVAPHSAFEDPTAPADAPPRESLELRAFVFFDE